MTRGGLPASQNPRFAAPEVSRGNAQSIGPSTDVFHLALLSYLWLGDFWPRSLPGEGPGRFAYDFPPLRTYAPDLPEGVAWIIHRGLAVRPSERWSTPREFVGALSEAWLRAQERRAWKGGIRWEIAAHSRPGRSKGGQGRENEDRVIVRRFADPDRAFVAVMDGISLCDVGSGALASLLAATLLERAWTRADHAADFLGKMPDLCRRGSQLLLEWAMEKGYGPQLQEGADLMGTTITAGWLEGRHLHLANVGDSRAYLIGDQDVEQLTIDDDLGTAMLIQGMPPESVLEIGPVARSLNRCLGGCSVGPGGALFVGEDFHRPTFSSWPLVPGDAVVLCTDGLVDEGTFLEPETMGEIVRTHRARPVEEVVLQLADQADAMQRPPTALEPEGFGDNISLVLVRVFGAERGPAG